MRSLINVDDDDDNDDDEDDDDDDETLFPQGSSFSIFC